MFCRASLTVASRFRPELFFEAFPQRRLCDCDYVTFNPIYYLKTVNPKPNTIAEKKPRTWTTRLKVISQAEELQAAF